MNPVKIKGKLCSKIPINHFEIIPVHDYPCNFLNKDSLHVKEKNPNVEST